MKCLLRSGCFAAWLMLLACDPRGVSVGSAELCVLDPALAAANTTAAPLSNCARLGANRLTNPGFEAPVVGACQNGFFCQFPAAELGGWQTSSGPQLIEVWHDLHRDVPAPEGSQFVELDATSPDTLWQDVSLMPGQLMFWSLLHRGRNGVENLELSIGSPDASVIQATLSSDADDWYPYSGLYRVGLNEPTTRFALVSRSGVAEGNLVDAVVFAPVD